MAHLTARWCVPTGRQWYSDIDDNGLPAWRRILSGNQPNDSSSDGFVEAFHDESLGLDDQPNDVSVSEANGESLYVVAST